MGHRHLFSTSQMFEGEQDQNWNHMHVEQPDTNLAGRAGSTENGSFFYPAENMLVDGMHFAPGWTAGPMSNGYMSSSHSVEVSPYQPDPSGSSHDPFLHQATVGTFCPVPGNYVHHASSSNFDREIFCGIEGGVMGNGRGHHKRKSPGIPSACDRGGTSGYFGAGSSSNSTLSPELLPEKPNIDPQLMPWEYVTTMPISHGNLSVRAEGSSRNVRSRSALDLESNLARPHLSNNPSNTSYSTSHPIENSSPVDFSGQSSSGLTLDWGHGRMSSAQARIPVSDASGSTNELNHFLVGSNVTNASIDVRGYHADFVSSGNSVIPQSFHGVSTHPARSIRSSYSQRSSPGVRAPSSSLRLGHLPPSDEGIQLVAESYAVRQRPSSSTAWRNSDRTGRSRISYERYRSLSNEAGLHDRFSSAGFMVVDHTSFHRSRNMFDQHRDMRLDIDSMSYEELLVLGERIGNVNTGLSEELIARCLTETVYCSSNQFQEEGSCAICLEEYKSIDDVGTLKACGHDYHVSCIRKWLSMKNLCPICKASALPDNMKG